MPITAMEPAMPITYRGIEIVRKPDGDLYYRVKDVDRGPFKNYQEAQDDMDAGRRARAATELHIVIGRNGFIREQDGSQSYDTVVNDLISGEISDVDRVLRIAPPRKNWPGTQIVEDVTRLIASTIAMRCDGDSWIKYDGAAYQLVEQHIGIAAARRCLDPHEEEAA